MAFYCTLADAKAAIRADNTTDDSLLLNLVGQASARIDLLMASPTPYFQPYTEARQYEIRYDNVDSGRGVFILPSGEVMLALTSASLNGSALSSVDAYPSLRVPIKMIRRTDGCGWYENGTDDPPTVTITGVWGYHRAYSRAWLAVDTLAAAIVTTTATTFTVVDVDGADVYGFTPRISAGNLVKIDSEIMEVIATTVATNTVTVRRGVNGTTAAAHIIAAPVSTWQTDDNIRRVTARQAGMLYARRGAYEQQTITDVGVITYPADLLAELRGVLQGFQYL
jgi:hypothetical protein